LQAARARAMHAQESSVTKATASSPRGDEAVAWLSHCKNQPLGAQLVQTGSSKIKPYFFIFL
jgi:hypothetical protein